MKTRVPWNQHEVALLFSAYQRIVDGADSDKEARKLSENLRNLAVKKGTLIDDTFRNVNGMKMQLANVQYVFTGGEKGLSGASALIHQMYEMYKSDQAQYQIILKEAIQLIGEDQSVEDAFFAYAKERIGLSSKMVGDYLQKATDYCHLKQPLLGMTDVKAVRNVQQKIAEGNLLRFRYGKDAQTIRNVTQLYYTFIKSYREPKEKIPAHEETTSDEKTIPTQPAPVVKGTISESSAVIQPVLIDEMSEELFDESSINKELSKPTAADGRWIPILQDSFPDGYILEDFLGQFQAASFWQEYYGDECPIQGDAIDAAMKAVGVVRDGRVFVRSEEDKRLIATICGEINNILSNYTTVYRSCIYDRYQDQLAAISIYTEQVMTQQLLTEAKGGFYSVNQVFAKPDQYASVIQDARKVLRDHGGPMPVDEVAKVLWFIPRDMVYHYLSVDEESLNIGNSTWMLAEHFPVTHEDAEKIGNMLDEYFLTNSYVQAFDLMPLLRDRQPGIADNLSGMTYQAVFNIVAYYLRKRFNFTKAIVSPKGTSVDFTDLFRVFAAERDTFTLTDLEALASELKLPIYWESTYAGGAVRISKTEFINKRLIQVDVDAIDTALEDFCSGDYLPLMSVSSAMMMHLPPCGYRWNGYLLQSYVFGFSKIFRLSYSSFSKTGYYGAMVRRSCKTINNYGSLIERVLTDDDTWETTADALDVLVKHGYQALRKYKGIDNVVAQAKRNKLPDDGR